MNSSPRRLPSFLFFYTLFLLCGLSSIKLIAENSTTSQTSLTSTDFLPVGSIDFVTIGDPNNPCDPNDYNYNYNMGAVPETYRLGKNNITARQYCAFLNAVAAKDDFGLYDERMFSDAVVSAITRTGTSGSYHYSVVHGQESVSITYVGWFGGARFCNWLQNGQRGPGTTEYGAYTLPSVMSTTTDILLINPGATYFLPTADQWYKTAYYNGGANGGYSYPTAAQLPTWTGAYGVEGLVGGIIQWLSPEEKNQYGPYSDQNPYWGDDPTSLKANNIGFRVAATLPTGSDSLPEPSPENTPLAQ